jgi:type II secretory pathway pseudopilin PulG
MKKRQLVRTRAGVGIAELIVALVIMGILGLAATKAFVSQARFTDQESKLRFARAVTRGSVNLLMAEARMVQTDTGVVAASSASGASSITLRVPVAMGLVCGTSVGGTVLSMMPTDSVMLAGAALSGYAYRTISGVYTYTEGATTVTSAGAATCAAASVTTVANGRVINVAPAFPGSVPVGTPAFLYQRVRYWFGNSSAMAGRTGLWRTLEATNTSEEIVAPFDTSSRFRFYRNDNDTSDVTVPPLTEIRGIELVLTGTSERNRYGRSTPEKSTLRTAVFFVNRIN